MSLGLITPLPDEMTEDTQDALAARRQGTAVRRSRPVSGSVGISLFSHAALPLRFFLLI